MFASGTFETCRPVPPMSVHRGSPEVTGARSKPTRTLPQLKKNIAISFNRLAEVACERLCRGACARAVVGCRHNIFIDTNIRI
jgi:hypothetical protein